MDNNGSVAFGHYGSNGVQSKAVVQDDQWHHVVGTMAPSGSDYTYSIYVDGKLDITATSSWGLTATSSGWAIGARYDDGTSRYDGVVRNDGTYPYQGLIGDVRIYDHALSATEIQAIYEEQSNGELPSPPSPSPPALPSVQPVEATFGGRIKSGSIGGATD
jgi:hypothetical protein